VAELRQVEIYTDGGCIGNPGPGGYGVVLKHGSHRREISGGFRRTTNNRMEILAAVIGLQALKEPCRVTLYSDSEYLVRAMSEGWVTRWQAQGWMRTRKEAAKNPDLWESLLEAAESHTIEWRWVRGHAGNRENERCDWLAMRAAQGKGLPVDEGYARERRPGGTLFDAILDNC
jgi:ribonuclease HI